VTLGDIVSRVSAEVCQRLCKEPGHGSLTLRISLDGKSWTAAVNHVK
jgi:hypothetical protein